MRSIIRLAVLSVVLTPALPALAQLQGPSTGSTPYVLPSSAGVSTVSILTTDNTGSAADDSVSGYGFGGIPDGLGALPGANDEMIVLVNHELGNTVGVTRAHGGIGAYVSRLTINTNTLAVTSGQDLMNSVYLWNSATQSSNTAPTAGVAFSRFCSADLPSASAFYNSANGLGSTARIFMHGEEGGATGWQQATVVTGADAGKSYTLGKFNLSTNGSGLTGIGAWENALASPFAQDKTVVISNNDGGSGIMSNSVSVYVGTKQSTGSEIDKAGLTNGTLKFVNVAGNTAEIVNNLTRATNITSGTRFSLSGTASTTFSRPEDGAWSPTNPNQYYFVTTDQRDQVSDGVGALVGQTRLWRLNFDDITNPDAGGTIDLILDGAISNTGKKTNMFDNMTISPDGMIFLQEDVGGAAHNGKVFKYDPATGAVTQILQHDTTRFGDLTLAATAPFTNDEESSGIIDITSLMAASAMNLVPGTLSNGERWLLSSDQAHYTTGVTAAQVEGGQLFAIHITPEPASLSLLGLAGALLIRRRA